MRNVIYYISVIFAVLVALSQCTRQDDFPVLKGPYLGQKPPGTTLALFAPGVVSKGEDEILAIFTPDGKELFYSTKDSTCPLTIMHVKQKNGVWTRPRVASFSGKYYDCASSVSPDGRFLFFVSMRPLKPGEPPFEVQNIWMLERRKNEWRNPTMLPPPINSSARELGGTLTQDGYFYFSTTREETIGGKCRSQWINGEFKQTENIHGFFNFKMPFFEIARDPDEKYLIFVSYDQEDGFGGFDLYVSFDKYNDVWTNPKNMGERINTPANEHFPTFSPDGQYLFFVSDRISKEFQSKNGPTSEALQAMENHPQNGSSDIYWVDAKIIEELQGVK